METGATGTNDSLSKPRSTSVRRWFFLGARIVVAVLILYALLQIVSVAEIVAAFRTARVGYLVAALALVLLNLGLQALKWRYFVRRANPESSNFETIASLLFGITLGVLTPGQIGEFGGRALRHSSLPSATVIGLTMIDKLQMLVVMGIAAVVSLLSLVTLQSWLRTLLIAVFWGICLYIFFRPGLLHRLFNSIPLRIFQREWAQDLIRSLTLLRGQDLLFAFIVTIGFYGTIYLQMFILLNAFSPVGWWQAFVGFAPMMFLKALVPISLGDLGIREASSVYFYSLMAIPQATALNASLLLFVINILLPAVVGLIFVPRISAFSPRGKRVHSEST